MAASKEQVAAETAFKQAMQEMGDYVSQLDLSQPITAEQSEIIEKQDKMLWNAFIKYVLQSSELAEIFQDQLTYDKLQECSSTDEFIKKMQKLIDVYEDGLGKSYESFVSKNVKTLDDLAFAEKQHEKEMSKVYALKDVINEMKDINKEIPNLGRSNKSTIFDMASRFTLASAKVLLGAAVIASSPALVAVGGFLTACAHGLDGGGFTILGIVGAVAAVSMGASIISSGIRDVNRNTLDNNDRLSNKFDKLSASAAKLSPRLFAGASHFAHTSYEAKKQREEQQRKLADDDKDKKGLSGSAAVLPSPQKPQPGGGTLKA